MVALRLAAEGYYGGDPERVMRARADLVLKAVQYVVFRGDYEDAYLELNKGKGG